MSHDVVIIGAGHNGLVCAFYLAKAGLKVKIVERRHVVGGAAVTEEFHPGFRNSTASYTVSLLNPKVISDMELHRHGLKIVERTAGNFIPQPDGRYLLTGPGRTKEEIAKFSAHDAARLDAYEAEIEAIADVLRGLVLKSPPNVVEGGLLGAMPELLRAVNVGRGLGSLSLERKRALFDLFTKPASDYLDGWFEHDATKGYFGFDAVVGTYASPMTPGTAYVQLHHCFGEVNGKKGAWGHAIGGMGAITQAMAKACAALGVEIETNAPVKEVILDRGRAAGVVLESGAAVRAPVVISNLNPKLLYTKLVPDGALPAEFLRRIKQWKSASASFRMNVALSALPDFSCLPGGEKSAHHGGGIYIAPTLAYMDKAYTDAKATGWSKKPIIEMMISSTLDDTLAPKGQHVASLFCQHVDPDTGPEHREAIADLMINTVDDYAPGFAKSVIGRQSHLPRDLEEKFGLVNGDIFHGCLSLDQIYSARPMLGFADYRGPVPGLYMCGSGTHPGGGVTGAPGHNAAASVLKDVKRRVVKTA